MVEARGSIWVRSITEELLKLPISLIDCLLLLVWVLSDYVFQNQIISQSCRKLWHRVHSIWLFSFKVHGILCWFFPFHFWYYLVAFSLFFFFLVNLPRSLSILFIYLKNKLFVQIDFLSWDLILSFTDFAINFIHFFFY